jgi:hypothetical protein
VHGSDRRDTTQQQQHQNPRIETVGGLNLNSTRRRQEEEDGKILIAHLKQEIG